MATNFVVTGLADYTNANSKEALVKTILSGRGTKDYFSYQTGVKYQTKIPYTSDYSIDVSDGVLFGAAAGSGTTTIKDITLSDTQLKIQEYYTKEQIQKSILGSLAVKGSDPNELPMSDLLVAWKGNALNLYNEKAIWQSINDGSTAALVAGRFTYFDGVIEQVKNVAGAYGDSAINLLTDAGIKDASVISHVSSVVQKIESTFPEFIGQPVTMAMSPGNFSAYSRALYNLNGTVTTQTIGANGEPLTEVYVPGTTIKAVSTIGLNGANNIVATIPTNIMAVYDLEGEDEKLELKFIDYVNGWRLQGVWKLGACVVDPSVCVITK
jgi:hypothetical protein